MLNNLLVFASTYPSRDFKVLEVTITSRFSVGLGRKGSFPV